jgi:Protein of unknown function DUF262
MAYRSTAHLFEDTNPRDLIALLRQIHTREGALPDFQRDFVWDPAMTKELIVSMAEGTYAGSVLRIPNTQKLFAWRAFQGAPALGDCQPIFLVLDGQQRLTSLYQVFYGVGVYRYDVDLRRLLDGADFADCLLHLRAGTRTAQAYESFRVQAQTLMVPLSILRDGLGDFSRRCRQVAHARAWDGERDTLEDALSEVEERWIRPIATYQFPVVTLLQTTSVEAVCRMFVKLHATGVKLSAFELLNARFWPQDLSLRRLWEEARAHYPIIGDFRVNPYYVLQIIALVAPVGVGKRNHVVTGRHRRGSYTHRSTPRQASIQGSGGGAVGAGCRLRVRSPRTGLHGDTSRMRGARPPR